MSDNNRRVIGMGFITYGHMLFYLGGFFMGSMIMALTMMFNDAIKKKG